MRLLYMLLFLSTYTLLFLFLTMNFNQMGFTTSAALDNCMILRGDVKGQSLSNERQSYHYIASPLEQHFIDNAEGLGMNKDKLVDTCALVYNASSPVNHEMLSYFHDLDAYNNAVDAFEPITYDIRRDIEPDERNIEQVCSSVKLHPDGLKGIFSSGLSSSNYHGGMEPLLPIQRSQNICKNTEYEVNIFYTANRHILASY